jgi:hypothetical protein
VSSFGGALLFAAFTLVLIILGGIWLMNKATKVLVGSKHRQLQEIVETGQVPAEWSRGYRRKLARLEQDGTPDQVAHVKEEARRHYLDNLDQLIQYAQTTPLVDGDDTRALLLRRLSDVRAEWQENA